MAIGTFSGTLSSFFLMPVFWLVIGVLFLGLELVNRRVIYFLPGCVAALILALLMVLHHVMPAYLPQPPATATAAILFWLFVTCGGVAVFAMLRPRMRRRSRRRSRRQLFIN
jgi:membrane-bound ClpP family serine protease